MVQDVFDELGGYISGHSMWWWRKLCTTNRRWRDCRCHESHKQLSPSEIRILLQALLKASYRCFNLNTVNVYERHAHQLSDSYLWNSIYPVLCLFLSKTCEAGMASGTWRLAGPQIASQGKPNVPLHWQPARPVYYFASCSYLPESFWGAVARTIRHDIAITIAEDNEKVRPLLSAGIRTLLPHPHGANTGISPLLHLAVVFRSFPVGDRRHQY